MEQKQTNLEKKNNGKNDESFECQICMQNRCVSFKPPCGHQICGVCLYKILSMEGLADKCALCRTEFPDIIFDNISQFSQYCINYFETNFHNIDDLTEEEHRYAAIVAAKEGNLELMKIIVLQGFDCMITTIDCVLFAAAAGETQVVKFLAKIGAEIDLNENPRITPVSIAAGAGHDVLLNILAVHGADLNKEYNGMAPVHLAALGGHVGALKILADHGADLNKEFERMVPFHFAVIGGHVGAIKILAEHGADFNKTDINGSSPIFFAAMHGHLEIVKMLAEFGADLQLKSEVNGMTVADVASKFGHNEIVEFLKEKSTSS